jgi:hypothetical protein
MRKIKISKKVNRVNLIYIYVLMKNEELQVDTSRTVNLSEIDVFENSLDKLCARAKPSLRNILLLPFTLLVWSGVLALNSWIFDIFTDYAWLITILTIIILIFPTVTFFTELMIMGDVKRLKKSKNIKLSHCLFALSYNTIREVYLLIYITLSLIIYIY